MGGYHWNWGIFLAPVSTGEPTSYLGWLVAGLWNTVAVSLAAWLLALAVGSLMGVLRTVPNRLLAGIGTAFKQLPPDTQFYSASIVCLGLFTAARVCEQVRSGIEALPRGQRAAGLAMGLTLPQTYRFVLLPVAFRIIVPPLSSEFLNIFKNSAVASTIGLLELSAQARQLVDYTAQTYESFIAVTLAYALINVIVMGFMRRVDAKTRLPGYLGG